MSLTLDGGFEMYYQELTGIILFEHDIIFRLNRYFMPCSLNYVICHVGGDSESHRSNTAAVFLFNYLWIQASLTTPGHLLK